MLPIKRPALRYFGGKWKIGQWVVNHFPSHISYVEPFCGGASVLLQKAPSMIETINDIDGNLINFFRVLRESPDELIRRLELTPYARAELRAAYETTDDRIEAARRYYVRSWQSFGGMRKQGGGWRYCRTAARGKTVTDDWCRLEHLNSVAQRLRMTQIDSDDAISIIKRYDTSETLFYVDPPYVLSARSDKTHIGYEHEMDDEQHLVLSQVLHSLQGMVVLSGYRCLLYDDLYGDWVRFCRQSRTISQGVGHEYLWVNNAAMSRMRQKELFNAEVV
jgi:DNA adenine methylase